MYFEGRIRINPVKAYNRFNNASIGSHHRGGSRIFLGGGAPLRNCVTNTNKPIFFFRIPVVLESRRSSQGGVRTPCTLPLDPPLHHVSWRVLGTAQLEFANSRS